MRDNGLRLVLARLRDPDSYFGLEVLGNDLWARLAGDVSAAMATAFIVTEWDSWTRCWQRGYPRLVAPPNSIVPSGLSSQLAQDVEASVCRAEALIAASRNTNLAVLEIADYVSAKTVAELVGLPRLKPNDARRTTYTAYLASYLAVLPRESLKSVLATIAPAQPEVARLLEGWTERMHGMDPEDRHGRCAVYRAIHADSWWLDTIVVECPVEGFAFGSGRRPRQAHSPFE